ncbi:hypothetical protein EHS25_007419 [Saitozyma podzolica]|uniref:CRAL-TRIO domain-containing protein n=1 Tax=Saitozyma podzolica TaxID=1890683 RepID=A0A427YPV0_9TREE|nr:hypothetical protein EHS25_007419 [Saitozyma podzolica]
MSSFFSSRSKSAPSSAASSLKGKDVPPPTHDIFLTPEPGCEPKKRFDYDEAQLKQILELKHYTDTLLLPATDPYYPWELRFLNDPACHPRYMRAAKWKMDDAKRRIKGTIEWRREFKPELIEPEDVSVEAETGKIIISGFDYDARPIIYMRPGRENTETSPRQIRHLIFNLERAIDLMPPGQEQVAIIVDYKSATSQSNPSIGTARKVLNILQNHYVERLGRGLVVNMPWWINAFFSGISPFMDPITRDKIRFNPKLTELVPPSQLDYEFGGDYHLNFDHKIYWKQLIEFCHIAPDGTRVDEQGKPWVPPLGNGIKAAVDGLEPVEGAVATGQLKANGANGVNGAAAAVPVAPTESQKIASEHRKEEAGAEAEGTCTHGDGTAAVVNGVAGLSLANGNVNGNGVATALAEPPATETKPGAPLGEAVFDHPPNKEEKEAAKEIVEARS